MEGGEEGENKGEEGKEGERHARALAGVNSAY